MSEDNQNKGGVPPQNQGNGGENSKDEFVSKKAYEEVSQDMHKFKQKAKELEATVTEFKTQLKAQEDAKLQEQEKWKELFEKRNSELEELRQVAAEKDQRIQNSVKMAALKQEIGGIVRDEYLKFADLSKITMTEAGTVDKASLQEVANAFRKEHGQLIQSSDEGDITGHAPSNFTGKSVQQMSHAEKVQMLEQLHKQKH